MKLNYRYILLGIVLLIMLMSACREVETTTEVHPDGSCTRTVFVNEDSTEVAASYFPFPTDTSWSITQDTADQYLAEKWFARVSDLNDVLQPAADTLMQARITVQLEKHFRWFHTRYKYRETYRDYNPYQKVPVTDYLSPEDLRLYYLNEDTLDIEDKTDAWSKEAIFEEFYQPLLEAAGSLNDPELTAEMIQTGKPDLYNAILDLDDNELDIDRILESCAEAIDNSTILKLRSDMVPVVDKINRTQEFLIDIHWASYLNSVVMPGLILDTNAEIIEGNRVTWEFKGRHFLWRDQEMWVESRMVNRWAIWVSVIVFILFAGLMIVSVVYKRRG